MRQRDVIDHLMRKVPAERIGLYDSPWPETQQKWLEQGYPADSEGNPVDWCEHLGLDMCPVGPWFDALPLRGALETLEETNEWAIKRDGGGGTLRWWKHKSGTPEHLDFRMTNRNIWDSDYRPHLLVADRQRVFPTGKAGWGFSPEMPTLEQIQKAIAKRRACGCWIFYGHVFIWEIMRHSMGDLCMYESLVADPEWIHDFNRVYTDFYKAHIKILVDEAGIPDGFWLYEDLGYRNGLFCSPQTLEELIFPYYKELVEFLHSYNVPVVLHSCGGVEAALPLIVQAGFDGLNPMEVKAGCNVLKFAEEYGDQLTFVGGLDVRILESGDRDLIRKSVIRLMEGMKARGAHFIFGTDHSVSPNTRYADYQYALHVYREHMLY